MPLIDANEAYKIARSSGRHDDFGRCMADLTSLKELLEDCTTVDAVEVVRCEKCKHWQKCESSLIGDVMCCTGQGSMYIQKAADDFCSYGERRE